MMWKITLGSKIKMKKEADEKFKQALLAAMKQDEEKLEEELKNMPPHEFSPEFEAKMEEILKKRRRRFFGKR